MEAGPQFKSVALDLLGFDPENPRFPTTVDGRDTPTVLEFMLHDAGLADLMRSIAKQGFFPGEPLLVSPDPDSVNGFIVVEGNRRLAACMLLANPNLAPRNARLVAKIAAEAQESSFDPVPCLAFSSRSEILTHLGYRHVTGIKEWEPLAKARFLSARFETERGSTADRLRNIARSIGSRADYVGRLLTALSLYRRIEASDYFGIPDLSETSIEFSLLSSVLAYADIVVFLGLDSSQDLELSDLDHDHLQLLTRVVFERKGRTTQLGESRNIRILAAVLCDERAREALEAGQSVLEASKILGGTEDVFRGFLSSAASSLKLALEAADDADLSTEDLDESENTVRAAEDVASAVRAKLGRGR